MTPIASKVNFVRMEPANKVVGLTPIAFTPMKSVDTIYLPIDVWLDTVLSTLTAIVLPSALTASVV